MDVVASWHRAWQGAGAAGDGAALRDALLAAYAEPQRRYHTRQHLAECLAAFDEARALAPHPAAVELALWFHDAIYRPERNDNEALSADWARSALLAAGVPVATSHLVAGLVLATAHTAEPCTPDESLLVDVDLAILGAAQPRFDEYQRQIREEYRHVDETSYTRGRRVVLQAFLDRARLYATPHFHHRLERAARENLARALAALPAVP